MEPDESAVVPSVTEVDEGVLRDLESKYIDVRCPVHDEPPKFEVGPDGAVVERFCCETLLSVFRELQASDQEGITSDSSAPPR
jgi:hypothetical protein